CAAPAGVEGAAVLGRIDARGISAFADPATKHNALRIPTERTAFIRWSSFRLSLRAYAHVRPYVLMCEAVGLARTWEDVSREQSRGSRISTSARAARREARPQGLNTSTLLV